MHGPQDLHQARMRHLALLGSPPAASTLVATSSAPPDVSIPLQSLAATLGVEAAAALDLLDVLAVWAVVLCICSTNYGTV